MLVLIIIIFWFLFTHFHFCTLKSHNVVGLFCKGSLVWCAFFLWSYFGVESEIPSTITKMCSCISSIAEGTKIVEKQSRKLVEGEGTNEEDAAVFVMA